MNRFLLSFSTLTELVVRLFLFARTFVNTRSSVILFPVSFDSAIQYNFQINGWHLIYQFHFNVHHCFFHGLHVCVLIYLFQLFLHLFYRNLLILNIHLFRRHGIHAHQHNITLSEAAWLRVWIWIDYLNHCIQVSGCFEKYGQVWLPTDVELCLQLCVWLHNLI